MREFLKGLLSSKKFVVSIINLLVAVAVQLGVPEVNAEQLALLLAPGLVYVGAQGAADFGKEKAKVDGGAK